MKDITSKYRMVQHDLTGGEKPSLLYPFMVQRLGYLLDPDRVRVTEKQIRWRRKLNPIIKKGGRFFLQNKQVLENRNILRGIKGTDKGVILPETPVIWAGNHSFKDDTLATVLVSRHSYVMIASLPMFFNSLDGILAFLNGVVLMNRKVKESKSCAARTAIEVLNMGADLILFPEGVWNKTPERLLIDLWPGVYRMATESGCPVVPVIHYLRDAHSKAKDNLIHTVIDDPIDMTAFSEDQGIRYLRDVIASWYYLMMERYGKSTRAEVLKGFDMADDAWDDYLEMHTRAVPYYDLSIETTADYRPKQIARPGDVFRPIADLKNHDPANMKAVIHAQGVVECEWRRDFQRRF